MLSDTGLFHLALGGNVVTIEDVGLSEDEKAILETVRSRGYDKSVFIAYMAETYPLNVSAPTWRRLSGTCDGVWVSEFIHSIPGHDQGWIDLVNELIPGEQSPIDKVFVAWLKGTLPLERFAKWHQFHDAASRKLMRSVQRT